MDGKPDMRQTIMYIRFEPDLKPLFQSSVFSAAKDSMEEVYS